MVRGNLARSLGNLEIHVMYAPAHYFLERAVPVSARVGTGADGVAVVENVLPAASVVVGTTVTGSAAAPSWCAGQVFEFCLPLRVASLLELPPS